MIKLLRSLLFNFTFYFTMLMGIIFWITPLCLLKSPAPMRKALGKLIDFEILMFQKIIGLKIVEIGVENIPTEGAFILCAKHMSNMDALLCYRRCPTLTALAKISLFRVPFVGSVLSKMGVLGINRGAGTAHKETPKVAQKVKDAGIPLLIFAEGTRIKVGQRKNLKSGAFYIQKEVTIPVIVMAHNTGQHWIKNQIIKEPGTVYIEYYPAIKSGLNKKDFMEAASRNLIIGSEKLMKMSDPNFTPKSLSLK